jgi:chloramphenicol-sensitive protein RarD
VIGGAGHEDEWVATAMTSEEAAARRLGLISAASAYFIWGLLPGFLKLLHFADPREILAARILWSLPAAAIAVAFTGGFREAIRALRKPGIMRALALSSVFIGVNWWIYVWAVANAKVIEASLAYFLTPLVNVAFGVALFNERLNRTQIAALTFAAIGVLVQGIALGAPPYVALALCATWSLYGLVRKQAPVPAAAGLMGETLILAAPAVAGLLFLHQTQGLAATQNATQFWLMALSGPATAIPLILFAFGARRLPFTTLGLLQYIAPSMQFLLGVAFGEPLTPLRLASFALIWGGLALFTWNALRPRKAIPAQ